MERWTGRVALVTGASAGIGAAVTRDLANHGMTVIGCSRRIDNIQKIRDEVKPGTGKVIPIKCDLRKEAEISAMFAQIRSEVGRLDVCVNNAGLAHPARLMSGETEAWREMFEVNVLALSICTRESLKLMGEKGIKDGHIIHISSLSGYRLEDGDNSFYACTKHAVKAHTEGLRRELLSSDGDTRITSISPGNVETEFVERKYGKEKAKELLAADDFKSLEAKDISDAVIYALSAPQHVQIFDVLMRPNHQPS